LYWIDPDISTTILSTNAPQIVSVPSPITFRVSSNHVSILLLRIFSNKWNHGFFSPQENSLLDIRCIFAPGEIFSDSRFWFSPLVFLRNQIQYRAFSG
jgi:hypothetical protein